MTVYSVAVSVQCDCVSVTVSVQCDCVSVQCECAA